jgi:hypothetical protein
MVVTSNPRPATWRARWGTYVFGLILGVAVILAGAAGLTEAGAAVYAY